MFPLYDTTPRKRFPFMNYLLIAVNIYAFYLQLIAADIEGFTTAYSFIPRQFHLYDIYSYQMIITSIFLHGSLFHIASNMWFLHIFGDNVEDTFGHIGYLLFYVAAGIIATLTQYVFDPTSVIPLIGASGAISGVAGAYFVLFKYSKVRTIVPIFIVFSLVDIPVWLFLGYWFFIQLFSGLGSLASLDAQYGGIAFLAHVGGFIFGYLYTKTLYSGEEM